MNHYWVHNFNSTSSLLGGAVIAGGAENTSIYYNPATIGEMERGNNFSLAANLFSWDFYVFDNALGDGIDLSTDNFQVQPQFLSYSYKPPQEGLSISFAVLTRVKERLRMNYINSEYYDVLSLYQGEEKYNTMFNYRNDYNDTWVGIGLAYDMNEKFSFGISIFGSGSSLNYQFDYSATATYFEDSIQSGSFVRVAEGSYKEMVRFTDYRLIAKLGIAYRSNNYRLGLTVNTPSWRLFSSGKRSERIDKQVNIRRDENPAFLSDYVIFDGQQSNQLSTNFKIPFSTGLGFVYDFNTRGQKLYFSCEYFVPLKVYKVVNAQINPDITTPNVYDTLSNKDWNSVVYAGGHVFNIALGYSWVLSNDLLFISALRTDFSAVNKINFEEYSTYNYLKSANFNIYHYSGGVEFSINKSKFIAGGDIAIGYKKNQPQPVNFSDPVEYNQQSGRALQGNINNKMDMFYLGISIYLGATLNFISDKDPKSKNN